MTLISNLQALKDRLIVLPKDLGMPQYRELAVRKKTGLQTVSDYIFSPTPKIVNLNDRQISELLSKDTVQISIEDYFVKHISRVQHDRQFLMKDVDFYIVDYNNVNGVIYGIKAKPIFLDEAGTTSYSLILKRLSDHEKILS